MYGSIRDSGGNSGIIGIRLPREYIVEWLDRLDRQSEEQQKREGRQTSRFKYRVRELLVECADPSGNWRRLAVPSRNISQQGLSTLFPHFMYVGTPIRVHLVSIFNHKVIQPGKIVRCRYVPGTTGLHDTGVAFDSPIDVGMFHRNAVPTRILIADADEAPHKLAGVLANENNANIQITSANDGEQAVKIAEHLPFDLGFIELRLPQRDGFEVAKALRQAGCISALVAMSATSDDEARNKVQEAGFDLFLPKPLTRDKFTSSVTSLRSNPVISTFIHNRSMGEIVDDFVGGIEQRIREIATMLSTDNVASLADSIRAVRGDAEACGFETIAAAGQELEALVESSPQAADVRSKFYAFARIATAARGVSCLSRGSAELAG